MRCVLADVYPAGETPIVAADGRALARAVRVAGKVEPVFVERSPTSPAAIRDVARDGDVVVTMGAGSIGASARAAGGRNDDEASRSRSSTRRCAARCAPTRRSRDTRVGAVGGRADLLYVPADRDDLARFLRQLAGRTSR